MENFVKIHHLPEFLKKYTGGYFFSGQNVQCLVVVVRLHGIIIIIIIIVVVVIVTNNVWFRMVKCGGVEVCTVSGSGWLYVRRLSGLADVCTVAGHVCHSGRY